MKGLEISVVKFSKIKNETEELRIEAEHYQHKYQYLINKLDTNFAYLKDLVLKPIQTGHTPSMKDSRFYGGIIKFIKTDNLRDNEIKEPFKNFLSELGNSEIKRTELQEGDIITTIIGATYDVIARSCIIRRSHLPANINQNIAHIRPDIKKINPEFLNIYLNSKYGKMYLEYLSRQMEQVNLNCEEVGMVRVPMFPDFFQSQIDNVVKNAHSINEQSKSLYSQAENLLYCNLGFNDWKPKNTSHTIKKFSDFTLSGRLDAEYYQSKYDVLFERLSKVDCKIIKEIKIVNYRGFQPKYVDNGTIDVINSKHILEDGLDYDNFEKTDEISYNEVERSHVKYGDILTYTTGANIGRTQVYLSNKKAMASNHVNMLRVKDVNPIYLALVLNSMIGRMQTERACTGSAQVELYPEDIENFIVPILSPSIQEKIANLVQKSFEYKKQSKQLLQEAKQMIEAEIEKEKTNVNE